MNLKLGQKVKFKNYVLKKPSYYSTDVIPTIEFCKSHNIAYREDKRFYCGYWFNMRLRLASFPEFKSGIIVGKRNIDLTGYSGEDGYNFGKKISVYIIATNLASTYRVPIEYIEIEEESA